MNWSRFLWLVFFFGFLQGASAQDSIGTESPWLTRQARRFAPILRQDVARDSDEGSQDWITAFDWDGDWDSDNNWENQGLRRKDGRRVYPAEAVVYYSGVETETHAFLLYAFFHPRDWSPSQKKVEAVFGFLKPVSFLSGLSSPGALPGSLAAHNWAIPNVQEILGGHSHENDVEGALLILEKGPGEPRLVAVETIFHTEFKKYNLAPDRLAGGETGALRLFQGRPILKSESHGHGVDAWDGEAFPGRRKDGVVYHYAGRGEDPDQVEVVGDSTLFAVDQGTETREVGYRLESLETSLWPRARQGAGETFHSARDYPEFGVRNLGTRLKGTKYADHKASAPWDWADEHSPDLVHGAMVFHPVLLLLQHFSPRQDVSWSYQPGPFTDWAQTSDPGDFFEASQGTPAQALVGEEDILGQ